jgi:hypothetical protein
MRMIFCARDDNALEVVRCGGKSFALRPRSSVLRIFSQIDFERCRFRRNPFDVQMKGTIGSRYPYQLQKRRAHEIPEYLQSTGAGHALSRADGQPGQVDRRADESRNISVTDGPFTESKEVIGGLAILNANSKAEAIELAKNFLQTMGEGECEIRELFEAGADVHSQDAQRRTANVA